MAADGVLVSQRLCLFEAKRDEGESRKPHVTLGETIWHVIEVRFVGFAAARA